MQSLASLTSLGLGGAATNLVHVDSAAALETVLRDLKRSLTPVYILGGGSNLVIADEGVHGTVVCVSIRGIEVHDLGEEVLVTAGAGEPWDEFVAKSVSNGWSGVECLSGIPGSVGATPIQNVGAYGVEIASVFESLTAYDRDEERFLEMRKADCAFGYRSSRFRQSDRFVISSVTFRLRKDSRSVPITYKELGSALALDAQGKAPLLNVRETVIRLRRAKGMVLDPSDPESKSAGSFFTNPIVESSVAEALRAQHPNMPTFPQDDGRTKLAAGWLIEQSGIKKGWTINGAGISSKHALALVNRGGTTRDLLHVASLVRQKVREKFGIELHPEPILWGCTID